MIRLKEIESKYKLRRFAKRMAVSLEERLWNKVYQILSNRTIMAFCNDLEESGSPVKQDGTAFALVVYRKG